MGDTSTRQARLAAPVPAPVEAAHMSPAPASSLPVLLASALLLASCAGTGGSPDAGAYAPASAGRAESRTAGPAVADASPAAGGFSGIRPVSTGIAADGFRHRAGGRRRRNGARPAPLAASDRQCQFGRSSRPLGTSPDPPGIRCPAGGVGTRRRCHRPSGPARSGAEGGLGEPRARASGGRCGVGAGAAAAA